jgi:hypothetical protein
VITENWSFAGGLSRERFNILNPKGGTSEVVDFHPTFFPDIGNRVQGREPGGDGRTWRRENEPCQSFEIKAKKMKITPS